MDSGIHNKKNLFILSFLILGFTSSVSQLLILREFMISFYGNELSIGIIYAVWLLWVGIGSFFGNYINEKIKKHYRVFYLFIFIYPLVTIMQIILIKFSRYLLNTPPGEYITIIELLYFSFAVLSFGCLITGILFTLGSYINSSQGQIKWQNANRVYIYETLGSGFGGLLFSLVFISFFTPFQIAAFLVFTCAFVYILSAGIIKNSFKILFTVITLLIFIFFEKYVIIFENSLTGIQWIKTNPELRYITSVNTRYQNLSSLELNGQYTIFSNGKPVYNIPDTYNAENLIHLIFTQHKAPKKILIIGGGFNGLLKEILKYNLEFIDYSETDNALLNFAGNYLPHDELEILKNPKVNILKRDGREYVKNTKKLYDIILINTGEPNTMGANRFFTFEFYNDCLSKLTRDGITSINFPSSADYIGEELKDLNVSIYHTFKKVFPNNLLIPGTTALLLGSNPGKEFITASDTLSEIYRSRNLSCQYFSEYMFEQLMPPDRIQYTKNILNETGSPAINYDMNPVSYYFDIILWNKYLKSGTGIFTYIAKLNLFTVSLIFLFPLLLFYFVSFKRNRRKKTILSISMYAGGFCSIVFSLIFILNFQIVFGSIYEMLGGMVAANMFGLSAGAYLFSKIRPVKFEKMQEIILLFFLMLLSFLCPYIMSVLIDLRSLFLSLANMFFYSVVIGLFFGLLNKRHLDCEEKFGSIYGWDILGSAVGALVCSAILVPVLGFTGLSLLLVILLSFPIAIILLHKQA